MTFPISVTVMPRTPIHPDEHLAGELRELGTRAAELSRQIDVPVNRMNLQQQYELQLAEKEVGPQVASLPRRASPQSTRKLGKTA